MGFFSDSKPKVTRDEFKKLCSDLYYKGWSHKELDLLRSFFDSSLNESKESEIGLDSAEIKQGISQLRENNAVYHISEEKIKILEETFKKYI